MPMFTYRPGLAARRIQVPLLVVVAEQDQSVLPFPAVHVAARANAALVQVPGGHYAPFLEEHEAVAEAEVSFSAPTCVSTDPEFDTEAVVSALHAVWGDVSGISPVP